MADTGDLDYVIPTMQVPNGKTAEKLDTKMTSREKDGHSIKVPSQMNSCAVQLWEVYFMVGILLLQPPSSVVSEHVKALCEHSEPQYLCEAILKEHCGGLVTDTSQEVSWYAFFEEYIMRKFSLHFLKNSLLKYATDVLDDPLCGWCKIPRSHLAAPHVQALMLNAPFWEGQYDELVDSMRQYNLPLNDYMADPDNDIHEAVGMEWDALKLYDDPTLILKKHGGWATTKGNKMISPKDQLIMRLTGMTLEQILLQPEDVPDSPRRDDQSEDMEKKEHKKGAKKAEEDSDNGTEDSSHPSDFEVDPEHPKVMPLGITICEAFCLFRGILAAENNGFSRCVIAEPIVRHAQDGHQLAAAVLIDLYMREQVDVHHWTLSEGSVAVPYRMMKKKGRSPMDHFLDTFSKHTDMMFREMRLPWSVGDYVIWNSLEKRGIIANHRPSKIRVCGCFRQKIQVWDLVRPDLILEFKEGYVQSARMLYDKSFGEMVDDEVAADTLMYFYVLQSLFDLSFECIDAMARVLTMKCSPFQKGELFPPVSMVHAGAVCLGLADRAFRVATHQDTVLAQEAAEYNELIMERFEHKFFLSQKVWESFDIDNSGELTLDEFVDGMRSIDLYKDFRKERIPDSVLRMIVSDLAERLFYEVDVNGDGSLTSEELGAAFKRRRHEALLEQDRRKWVRTAIRAIGEQIGGKKEKVVDARSGAQKARSQVQSRQKLKESRRQREHQSETDKPHLPDEDLDVNAPLAMRDH